MSNFISGKEALIALANGEDVQYNWVENPSITWMSVGEELKEFTLFEIMESKSRHGRFNLRLKPRTITLNGIEVPAPFEPKEGETFFYIDTRFALGHGSMTCKKNYKEYEQFGAWRTEEEIKQVVEALRSVFK